MIHTIYNLCKESLDSIPRESWDQLNNDINTYLQEHNIQEEIYCQDIFRLKEDELESLTQIVNETFETYPLIQTYFDEHRDIRWPPLDMIKLIRRWAQDMVEYNENNFDDDIDDDIESIENDIEFIENDIEDMEPLDPHQDYITIKYFQGLFLAVYEMFTNYEN